MLCPQDNPYPQEESSIPANDTHLQENGKKKNRKLYFKKHRCPELPTVSSTVIKNRKMYHY